MKTKTILIKSIALLLVLLTFFSVLVSCANGNENGGESSDLTENASGNANNEDGNDNAAEDAAGTITVYADGDYQARVVRAEISNDFDKTFYSDLRELFKKKVGKNPGLETDFVAAGDELDDSPAILVGDTDYAESKAVYKTLKDNQAKAVISGNKYVIAYSTETAGLELFEKLKEVFNKQATNESIVITSKWNITVTLEDYSFDESGVSNSATLPVPEGLKWNTSGRDAGHGSKIYIANNANSTHYTKYLKALETAGFSLYTTNDTLHTNKFATLITKQQIVSVMFFAPKSIIKVVVDQRSTFSLPGLKEENVYTKTTAATEFVQLGLKQISGAPENGMGYVVKLTDGRFIVVDGGFADVNNGKSSATFILNTLKKMQGNSSKKPVIAAWIVTHIHSDHAGAFIGMANNYASSVTLEKLIYNQPSDKQMNNVGNMSGRKTWIPNAITKFKNAGTLKEVVKAHPGQQFFFCDLTITVIGTIDLLEPSLMGGGNDSSVVTIFEMNGGKVLLSADSEPSESKLIRDIYGGIKNANSPLKANFVQVSHHGYGNTNTDKINGNDQNALNVMASGAVTASGSSKTYALIPVGFSGYSQNVGHMQAMKIFPNDYRLVAGNKNLTIKFNTDGTQTIEKTKSSSGYWTGTWST